MTSRKKQNTLWVAGVQGALVREINELGQPLMDMRFVGKTYNPDTELFDIIPEGQVVPYHPHYIARIKEGALVPMDQKTADLAGVRFNF